MYASVSGVPAYINLRYVMCMGAMKLVAVGVSSNFSPRRPRILSGETELHRRSSGPLMNRSETITCIVVSCVAVLGPYVDRLYDYSEVCKRIVPLCVMSELYPGGKVHVMMREVRDFAIHVYCVFSYSRA